MLIDRQWTQITAHKSSYLPTFTKQSYLYFKVSDRAWMANKIPKIWLHSTIPKPYLSGTWKTVR